MEASEVRFKNYVYDLDGSITQISGDDTFFDCQNYKPIPLTKEILLKFDFENWGEKVLNEYEKEIQYVLHNIIGGTSDFKVCLNISNYGGKYFFQFIIRIDEDSMCLECNYVHELQNIFYMFAKYDLTLIETQK